MYENGYGYKQDYSKAREYYELSAQQNDSAALSNLGDFYYHGCGVKQSYLKAKEYYELSAKLNNSHAINKLGYIYEKGYGVEKDFSKAKEYYQISAKKNNSSALNNLGYIYENGFGVETDYLRAKQYYEFSAKNNNSTALINLGYLYENGYGFKQNYQMAKKYYQLAAKKMNSEALLKIGYFYKKGHGVERNYMKAKKYYEKSIRLFNSYGFLEIGNLYRKGHGVVQNFQKAEEYYKLSSQLNNPHSFYYLGCFYSNGENFDIDIPKAIFYLKKCTNIHYDNIEHYDLKKESTSFYIKSNKFFYPSFNDLGLIYIICNDDITTSTEYIKQAAFAEYPYGQNNFGLMNEFYLNEIGNAVYMYERSSKHNFVLAEYNLGHYYEKNKKIEDAITYYIKASEDEEVQLIYRNHHYHDTRLEISKTFIICLANLKLVEYYFFHNKYDESRKYFIKAFSKIKIQTTDSDYQFRCNIHRNNTKDLFLYLKFFILNFPLFNLMNQPNISLNLENSKFQSELKNNNIEKHIKSELFLYNIQTKNNFNELDKKNNNVVDKKNNFFLNNTKINKKEKYEKQTFTNKNILLNKKEYLNHDRTFLNNGSIIFDDLGKLFDFIIDNQEFNDKFLKEIKMIVNDMEKILYTPPYNILFGRINIAKPKHIENHDLQSRFIDKYFYKGFGIEKSND